MSYRLTGGDTDQFAILSSNGQLQTQTGVDYNFEARNRYSVTVEAADDQGGRTTITVTIDITDDDNEQPDRPDRPSVTASTLNSLSIRWTAPSNPGPNINDYDVQYKESSGTFTDWPHTSRSTSTTITSLTANTQYEVQVLARSPEGQSQWSESVTVSTVANQAPTFNEGSSTTRRIAENTTGTHNIGNPITATDRDGGTLTYRLEGTDQASFSLDGNQLQTLSGVIYNFEEKNRYEVTVRVEDGQGGSNTIEVTINLIDEQEPPETPNPPSVSAASSTSLTVTWDEPTNTGPDINRYNVQYREGDSGGFTSYSHNSTERTATITGRTPGTSYEAQVRAHNAEGWSDWSTSGTGSTSANELPVFTDRSSATRSFDENTTGVHNIGDPISATDPENTTLAYSLEGQDKDAFTIDTRNGQIRTKSGQTYDYETQPSYLVDVKATDGHSGDSAIPVFIDLNDVNEPPTFISDATFEAEENNQFAGLVDAEDVDSGDGITGYTITGGSDRDLLEINSGGTLTFKDAPNFENPTDSGRNNTYIVEVTVTGGTGGRALTAAQTITITVTDENELPHFTSDDAFTVKENNKFVGRMAADDIDRADRITGYEVTGGSDQNEFEITNTNQLHFQDDPDFERPADSGNNNEYIIEVTATGGADTRARTVTQEITVTVEDEDEPPGKPDPPTASNETENSLTVSWDEPTNTGPDITNYHVQYRISGAFTDWSDTGPSRTRTITGLRSGTTYQIQVQAENAEGKGAWSNIGSGTTLTAPTVSSVAFTSAPASGQNNTYKLNDIMDITVTFNEAVTVTGTPQIDLTIDKTVHQADYKSGSGTTQLVFQYTVQNTDEDTDGATINANGLKLNGGRIRRHNTAITADLVHAARTNQSSHKVDGIAPGLTDAEVKDDELALTYGEVLDSNSKPATSDFAVTVDGTARSVSTVTMRSSEVELTLASAVTSGQTVILAYTPGTNPIRDRAHNPAVAFTTLTVANETQVQIVSVCSRTAQVRDAIIAASPVSTCGAVTADHLSAITSLSLFNENISTLKANDFSGMIALQDLILTFNSLTTLPDNVFSGLTALEELSLNFNDLSTLDADAFSELTALKKLYLSNNDLSSLNANIFSNLSALEILYLHDNDLSTLDANIFSNLSALKELSLSRNDLSSLNANIFSNLSALEELYMSSNDLTSLPANIFSNLSALKVLSPPGNKLSSLDANIFSNLSALEELYLSSNELTSLPANIFSNLSVLKRLGLDNNDLSSLDANIFSNLSALQRLDLDRNTLTTLPANIFSNLSVLEELYLEENDLSSLNANAFSGLTALETLWLHENDLQSTSLPTGVFSSLTTLETLRLDENQLSSLLANLFSGLSSLQELYLNGQQTSHELSSLNANTFSGLTALKTLWLDNNNLSSLPNSVFSKLTELTTLKLSYNNLSSLPDSVFFKLTELTTLKLESNTVDPLPITISLESVTSGIFRAKAHTGAPFAMLLPLYVVNGTIDGGASSIEISQGNIQSNTLTISRTTGTTAAVTADIGTLPDLPPDDSGYALVKSTDLPLTVIDAEPGVNIYPTALTIPEGNSDTYTAVLTSQPTADVTVTVTVPTGSDASASPSPLTFTQDNWNTSQAVTVTTQTDTDNTDDTVTLTHAVSGGNYQSVTAENVTVTIAEVDVSTNNSPVFTSANIFDIDENETEVGTVVATDADARDYITGYEITGGAAQALFSITSGGVLTFVTAPDYERPSTTASNNRYVIVVTATSGTGTRERTATQTITVVVDDVDEPPGQPPAPILVLSGVRVPIIEVSQGRTQPTNTGPDITAYDIQYRVVNTGDFKSTSLTLGPDRDWPVRIEELNRNQTYEVQVRAINDEGESEWSPSAEMTIPNTSPIASSIDDVTLPAGGAVERVDVDDVFDDPDDSRLRYTASSSNSAAATVQMSNNVVLITPVATGTATITVTATDPWGASTSTTFDANIQTPTLSAPTLSISGNLFTIGFTDNFAANEIRAYRIRVRQKTPIAGGAAGCVIIANDNNIPTTFPITLEDLISDFFEPGTTYEADYGYLGTDCGDSVIGVRSATAEATTDGTPSFDIDLVFVGSISSKYRTAVETATQRWEQIIAGDIPNHHLSSSSRSFLNRIYPGTTAPEVVDDLRIYVEIEEIDGEGGTLGQAGPDLWRIPSSLPIAAGIELDEDDLGTMSNQLLAALILHEIGHTLGFGVVPWDDHNLLQNPSLDVYKNRIVPAPDTHFSGANAIAAFNDAGGSSYTGAKVPVENTFGGSGSQDRHWRESVLGNELMTPRLASTGPYPMSASTIQSLADIGYRVDVTQADAYTLPSTSSTTGVRAAEGLPINCTITIHPDAGPDKPEPITLNLKPAGN